MAFQLKDAEAIIGKIANFLEIYLPLANAHASDFITKDFWENLLPCRIQKELLNLSESELKGLSFICDEQLLSECPEQITNVNISGKEQCISHDKPPTINTVLLGTEQHVVANDETINFHQIEKTCDKSQFPDKSLTKHKEWRHNTLAEFCLEARACTIEEMGLAMPYGSMMSYPGNMSPFVGTFMNEKKSHEIEEMAAVCKTLVNTYDMDLVIDFGSGKGYLGSYLSLQYDIPVLGIDAVSVNTKSAEKRTNILTKQWSGLTRKKEEEVSQIKLTKRERKLMKVKGTTCETSDNSKKACKSGANSKSNQYKPVTMFIENFTDLNKLVADKFPELCHLKNETYLCKQTTSDILGRFQDSNTTDCTEEIADAELSPKSIETNKLGDNNCTIQSQLCGSEKDVDGLIKNLSLDTHSSVKTDTEVISDHQENETECRLDVHGYKHEAEKTVSSIKSMLTGLHTCGNLASTSLELFVNSPMLKVLCNVGCCYHLLTEEFLPDSDDRKEISNMDASIGFPLSNFLKLKHFGLGQTARNLASQSVHRLSQSELQGKKFFPRALLEVLIQKMKISSGDIQGKSLRGLEKKCNSLHEFISKACIKLDTSHQIDDSIITDIILEFSEYEHKLAAFFQLRTVLAPCIESLIILDRVCYLLEQDSVTNVNLVKMFDPVISPRCYGIIATTR